MCPLPLQNPCVLFAQETTGFGFHPDSMGSMVSFCRGRNVGQFPEEISGLERKAGNTVQLDGRE